MKKILSFILFIIMISTTVSAQEFLQLGERPIYENYYTNENAVIIDALENELYGNAVEITEDEWFATDSYGRYGNADFPYNVQVWQGEISPYNDGIKHMLETGISEDWGEEVSYEVYKDINDNVILRESGLPGGFYTTNDYYHYYNFGYFIESIYESSAHYSDSHVFPDDHRFVFSTITNAITGDVYKVDNVLFSAIDNNGNIYFSYNVPKDGKENAVYYKAELKKYAIVAVYLDGQKIAFDQVPFIENGRTLVPVRAIFENLGATVEWNGDTQTVTATKSDTSVSLTIDNTVANKNGEEITLDVPAKVIGGRTFVPLRFVSDCFGVNVEWNANKQCVILTTN